jgi:hypothetical protein
MTPTPPLTPNPADLGAQVVALVAAVRVLEAEVRQLKAARPAPWLSPEQLAARLHPRRTPSWWRDACRLGLVPGAVKNPDSGKWVVPAETTEQFERDGLPVLPRRVYQDARAA